VIHLRKEILFTTQAIRELSRTEKYKENVELLVSVPGIAVLSAMIIFDRN